MLAHSQLLSTRTPRSFLQSCFPASWPGVWTGAWLFLPRCGTLHFSLLNFMRFLFALFFTSFKSTKRCHIIQTYQNKETTMLQTGFLNSRPEVPPQASSRVFRISAAFPCFTRQSEQEINLLRTAVSAAFTGIVDVITHKGPWFFYGSISTCLCNSTCHLQQKKQIKVFFCIKK